MEFGDRDRKVPQKTGAGKEEAPSGESLTTGSSKREGRAELPPPSPAERVRPDAYLSEVDPAMILEFDNGVGRPMVARILLPGDAYGRDGCLTWEMDGDRVGIEFYDAVHRDNPHFPVFGQFVSRYNLSTLTGEDGFGHGDAHVTGQLGLDLHGGVPEWEITGSKISEVLAWAKGVVASRQQAPAIEVAPGPQHSHVNAQGCQVFRDDNAKQKLMEWGYPLMGGSRYPFDENLKGWEQFDTDQDAPYYGIWTSVDRMAVVHYTEGDVTLVVAPDEASFKAEVRSLWNWNHQRSPDHGAHTQLDSPRLHAACLVGHEPFDQVLAAYNQQKVLERQYEELHKLAFTKLDDPSLPKNQFHVKSTENHSYFLRGRAMEPRSICVCRRCGDDLDLNQPDFILPPWSAADAKGLAIQIKLLEEFVGQTPGPETNQRERGPLVAKDLSCSVTSESGFQKGLTVHLVEKGVEIGKFSVVKDEDGYANDVEVADEHRGRGAGVALLLLAMQEASTHEIGFEMDYRGVTAAQKAVYASAERRGLIETPAMGCTRITEAGEALLEDLGLLR